jgi:hypothetical protein
VCRKALNRYAMRTLRRWGDAKCWVYHPSLPSLEAAVLGAANGMTPPLRNISYLLIMAEVRFVCVHNFSIRMTVFNGICGQSSLYPFAHAVESSQFTLITLDNMNNACSQRSCRGIFPGWIRRPWVSFNFWCKTRCASFFRLNFSWICCNSCVRFLKVSSS